MSERVKITIVGAGVVGCAIAYMLSKKTEDIFVIEKNPKVAGENQSSRNSGVIHAGIYYPKDESPLKSKLSVIGNGRLYEFCQEYGIPHRMTGKLVVATEEWQLEYLADTFDIAIQNNVPGAKMLSAEQAKALEPNVHCLQAAYFPTSGIVEPTQLVRRLSTLAKQNGVYFLTGTEVSEIKPKGQYFEVGLMSANRYEILETEVLINSAGLYSDVIAKRVNPEFPYEILPVRGEMAKFYKSRRPEIFHHGLNIYPTPYPLDKTGRKLVMPFAEFQSLFKAKQVLKTVGVHLTPTFDMVDDNYEIGNIVTIGPAMKGVEEREDYARDLFDPAYFWEMVNPFFPNLRIEDIELHQTGIQAKLKNQFDWVIEPDEKHPRCIQLVGIDSPGLTACLAIAEYVTQLVQSI